VTRKFHAKRADEPMWGRVILRSAQSEGGLESATVKAAWLDECLAPETMIDTEIGPVAISVIVNQKLPLKVWSWDVSENEWQLRPIMRWIRLPQREAMLQIGNAWMTPNHKVYVRDHGYMRADALVESSLALYNAENTRGDNYYVLRGMWKAVRGKRAETFLQPGMFNPLEMQATGIQREIIKSPEAAFFGSSATGGNIETPARTLCGFVGSPMGSKRGGKDIASEESACRASNPYPQRQAMGKGRQRSAQELAAGETCESTRMGERASRHYRQAVGAACLQNRCCRTDIEDSYRGRQRRQSSQAGMVQGEWVDVSTFLESHGGDVDRGRSSDGAVYNLTVEGNHNYLANGLLVANCGQDNFRLDAWEAVQRRLSLSEGPVLGTTTPYNLGWLKTEVIDRWQSGDKDYHVTQAESIVNPAFPRSEYERARRTLADWKFQMFYRGILSRPPGLIYGDFTDDLLMDPFAVPLEWPRYVGIDPGAVHTALIWIAEDVERGAFYIYRESLSGDMTTKEHVAEAQNQARHERVIAWAGGSSSEKQFRLDWQEAGLFVQEPAVSDVESGIDRVIELFKSKRLFVFNDCRGMRDELGTYSREMGDDGQPTEKIKDKQNFHRLDALRYIIAYLFYGSNDTIKEVVMLPWQSIGPEY
jgi:hypothetical protein